MLVSVAVWGSLLGVPAPPEEPYPATLDLQWNAPPGCSSAEAIEARIEALLSGPPRGDGEAKVVADVRRVSGGVHMTLTTTFAGAADVREVDSASCEALADATAVLLAVSLEPGLEAEVEADAEPQPEPAPSLEPAPAILPEPPQLPATPSSEPPEPAVEVSVPLTDDPDPAPLVAVHGFVGGGAERGAVQDWTGVVQAGLGMRGRARPWAAEVGGTYVAPRRHDGGLYQVGAASVRACWAPGRGPWGVFACGGGEFGLLRVDTRGLVPTRTVNGPSHGVAASLGGLWQRERLAAFVRSEGVVLLSRSRTTTGGSNPEERAAQRAVSLRLMVGLRFDFTPVD